MNAKELYDEWTAGETTGVRPARVQELRPELRETTGLYVPRSRADIDNWLPRMKGQITKKLRQAAEAEETDADAEADAEGDSEEESSD